MKKIIGISFLLLFLLPSIANAHDFVVDGIFYEIIDNQAYVARKGAYSNVESPNYKGHINIPSTVTYLGVTYPVTGIATGAFERCNEVTDITIPNTIIHIGIDAFSGTAWYDQQPDGLVYVGNVVYKYKGTMPDNARIVIKDGTLGIADNAFGFCRGLTSIDIPNSVIIVGQNAFSGTAWYNQQPDGLVYAGNVVYKYKGTMPDNTHIRIKEGTPSISPNAFSKCAGLTSVDIPNSVTYIGSGAFNKCSGLTNIDIPNSVISIGSGVFCECSGLTSVAIPTSLTAIPHTAFAGCTSLKNVTIPNTITSIDKYAFHNCSALAVLNIPNSVITINSDAFKGTAWYNAQPNGVVYAGLIAYNYKGAMPQNAQIELREGTIGIAPYAFNKCGAMASVIIPNTVKTIGDNAFAECTGLKSVTIPNSVKIIGYESFRECSSLTSVNLPKSIAVIDIMAFAYCSALEDVYIDVANPSSIIMGDIVFVGSQQSSKRVLHVPAGSLAAYKAKNCWSQYFEMIVEKAQTGSKRNRRH